MTKKNAKTAKRLAKLSLDENGFLDEAKVRLIATQIAKLKPQGAISILKTFKRLIQRTLAIQQIILESPVKIPPEFEMALLKKTGAKIIIHRTNADLVFGVRITKGDWVWDETLDAKLKQISNF